MSYTGLMQSTCTIQRLSGNAPDSRGIVKPAWSDLATGVPCSLVQLTAKERLQAQGWQLEVECKLLLPPATDLRAHPPDRVVVDSDTYLVLRVDGGRGKTLLAWLKRDN